MILCWLGAMSISACMTVPASSSSSMSGLTFGSGTPPTSFSSTSGYSSNGATSSAYSSASAATLQPAGGAGSNDPSDAGAVPPGYSNNAGQSSSLTGYLQSHRLPLVGAQVLNDSRGDQQVILYGFVASDFGKQDAADKARQYLHNPNVPVVNRIAVRPELASGASGSASPPPAPQS